MTPDEARQLKPGDRLVYDKHDAGCRPCAVEWVESDRLLIRWPESVGLVVWFDEVDLLGRFNVDAPHVVGYVETHDGWRITVGGLPVGQVTGPRRFVEGLASWLDLALPDLAAVLCQGNAEAATD